MNKKILSASSLISTFVFVILTNWLFFGSFFNIQPIGILFALLPGFALGLIIAIISSFKNNARETEETSFTQRTKLFFIKTFVFAGRANICLSLMLFLVALWSMTTNMRILG